MTLKQNSTPSWVYAVWAVFNLLAAIAINHFFSPSAWAYIISGTIYATGIGIMFWEIKKSGDTTWAPYGIQTAGVALFLVWCALIPA